MVSLIHYQLRNTTYITMANMTLRLPDDLDSQLKAQLQEKGISKHQLILNILRESSGMSLEDTELTQNAIKELQDQVYQLQKQVKVLAEHAGYPFGTF
ncbi:MAG: CopG family transcriptional regulator [Nostoc sp. DedQUE05]|uniref:ribbon-helix-helix domain-containing protein n=1 Tax=Nostoc sp. DedQUE05 TaxID=3075391 RepID=UPI002AD1F51D|nr:CopG family transcriptional regulator [Nostoc sp. DedQUE05]MDZ8090462.1 CopG family transcriptional regulator [Nostoc sp. DedQUE05]